MGSKRVGLARVEALIENLKREINLGANSSIVTDKLVRSESGTSVQSEMVATGTTGTIAVTKNTNNPVSVSQPAGTYVKDLILIPAGNIVTAGSAGNDFDVSIGTNANGVEILGLKALLDDGGSAVTMAANVPIHLIANGIPAGANAFATLGLATNEAMTLTATTYSATARTLHLNFKAPASGADLATAATTIKVIAVFATI
tara:strand:+ start:2071 stop:2676 length:606 start_codon:yes stop_codon:yes gene_type:complete